VRGPDVSPKHVEDPGSWIQATPMVAGTALDGRGLIASPLPAAWPAKGVRATPRQAEALQGPRPSSLVAPAAQSIAGERSASCGGRGDL
jgi:hypothetical protein